MNFSDIKKLIKLFEQSKISELEVEQEGLRVQLKKGGAAPAYEVAHTIPVYPPSHHAIPVPMAPSQPASAPQPQGHLIRAPMIGTFYRSPSPTSPSFVEEGDIVRKGQVLCIIEAMKLMNEIESDMDGRVVNLFIENGKPVQYGEPMFEIEPS